MFSPSEETLKRLQISRQTYAENSFFAATWGGLCRRTRLYSVFYFFFLTYGIVALTGFAIGVWAEDYEKFLDSIHDIPVFVNMVTQAGAYHFSQKEYLELFRAIDKGFFDYEETLDEVTKLEVAEIKSTTKKRKKVFGHYYTVLLGAIGVLQLLKKPVTYLMMGDKEGMDGENNLIWEAPFGMYVPYAEHWLPYVIGVIFGYTTTCLVTVTALASVIQYQCMSEELLAELNVVTKTFSKCVERAEIMFQTRRNNTYAVEEQLTMNDCILHCINHSVKHHQHTLRMMNVFKKLMYFPLFAVIFDGGIILCISSYILINNDLSMSLRVPMPCVIAAEATLALIFCYYGGKLTDANEDVGNGVYACTRWMDHSKVIFPYAIIVKGYCNIPNEISAAGFTNVNEQTFGNLLSAAYSYIGFILST